MPPIEKHVAISLGRTGKDYREVHEWLDKDPEKKAERHDITKMIEFGKAIEERHGQEGRDEYVQHLHDDMKAKFSHLQEDVEKMMKETLNYFGVR